MKYFGFCCWEKCLKIVYCLVLHLFCFMIKHTINILLKNLIQKIPMRFGLHFIHLRKLLRINNESLTIEMFRLTHICEILSADSLFRLKTFLMHSYFQPLLSQTFPPPNPLSLRWHLKITVNPFLILPRQAIIIKLQCFILLFLAPLKKGTLGMRTCIIDSLPG